MYSWANKETQVVEREVSFKFENRLYVKDLFFFSQQFVLALVSQIGQERKYLDWEVTNAFMLVSNYFCCTYIMQIWSQPHVMFNNFKPFFLCSFFMQSQKKRNALSFEKLDGFLFTAQFQDLRIMMPHVPRSKK